MITEEEKDQQTLEFYRRLCQYYEIHKNQFVQTQICDYLKETYNFNISQPNLSKLLNYEKKRPDLFKLLLICSALNLNPCSLLSEPPDFQEAPDSECSTATSGISADQNTTYADYKPYVGIFHCYFFPTLTNESKRGDMHYGFMQISPDEHGNPHTVEFVLHANAISDLHKETNKPYRGTLTVLPGLNTCYIVLQGESLECSFLSFRRVTSNAKPMQCRLAAVLTTSAGQGRNPTVHRMLMCRHELSDAGIKAIQPHLKMNSREILISENNLQSYLQQPDIPQEFKDMFLKNAEKYSYYLIREEHLRPLDIPDVSHYIYGLRNASFSRKYCKIGDTADRMLFDLLYGDVSHKEYFKER